MLWDVSVSAGSCCGMLVLVRCGVVLWDVSVSAGSSCGMLVLVRGRAVGC